MNQYRKYVFKEAHRKMRMTKKHGYDFSFADHLRNSWFAAKMMVKHNIKPYTEL